MARSVCSVAGCGSYVSAKGLCHSHYMRLRRTGSVELRQREIRRCSVDGCGRVVVAGGLCDPHYRSKRHKERRIAAKAAAERRCQNCLDLIPLERRANAVYCSKACQLAVRVASGAVADSARRSYFKNRYGLTVEDVDAMAARGCAICGTVDWGGRHHRPHVDHDHQTGKVRGVLCEHCNNGLGRFKDSPELLQRAIEYLAAAM